MHLKIKRVIIYRMEEEKPDILVIIEELQNKIINIEKENERLREKIEKLESIWLSREKY
jgi:hypothetical protein